MLKADAEFFRIIYHFFADGTKLTYAAIGVGALVAVIYFKIFFEDVSGFKDDVDKSEKIPIVDEDYDYIDSRWSSEKILIWILPSVGCGIGAYYQLQIGFPIYSKLPDLFAIWSAVETNRAEAPIISSH